MATMYQQAINKFKHRFAAELALRIAIAATLTIIITALFHLNDETDFAWLAAFSVIINLLMFPHQSQKLERVWERLLGFVIGCGTALIGAWAFKDHPALMILYACILTLYFAYLYYSAHRLEYAFSMSFIFLDVLITFYFIRPDVFSAAIFHFPMMVIIAIICIYIVDLFLPPHLTQKLLPDMLRQSYVLLDTSLRKHHPTQIDTHWFYYFRTMINHARQQINLTTWRRYSHQCRQLRRISSKLNYIQHYLDEDETLKDLSQSYLTQIRHELSTALHHIRLNQPIDNNDELHSAISELAQQINKNKTHLNTLNAETLVHELSLFKTDIKALAAPAPAIDPPLNHHGGHTAFSRTALISAIKLTLTILITIMLIIAFNIPGGYQTLIGAIVISIAPNTGAFFLKFLMRFGGIVVGGLAAMLVALLYLKTGNHLLLVLCFFLFVFFAARWALAHPRFNYAGMQCALIFLILLFVAGGFNINPATAELRLLGVISGCLIGLVINFVFAPTMPTRQLDDQLVNVLRQLQQAFMYLQPEHAANEATILQLADDIDDSISKINELNFHQRFLMQASHHYGDVIEPLLIINMEMKRLNRVSKKSLINSKTHLIITTIVDQLITITQHYCQVLSNPKKMRPKHSHLVTYQQLNDAISELDDTIHQLKLDNHKDHYDLAKCLLCLQTIADNLQKINKHPKLTHMAKRR